MLGKELSGCRVRLKFVEFDFGAPPNEEFDTNFFRGIDNVLSPD
jgi:hypothetical protein